MEMDKALFFKHCRHSPDLFLLLQVVCPLARPESFFTQSALRVSWCVIFRSRFQSICNFFPLALFFTLGFTTQRFTIELRLDNIANRAGAGADFEGWQVCLVKDRAVRFKFFFSLHLLIHCGFLSLIHLCCYTFTLMYFPSVPLFVYNSTHNFFVVK